MTVPAAIKLGSVLSNKRLKRKVSKGPRVPVVMNPAATMLRKDAVSLIRSSRALMLIYPLNVNMLRLGCAIPRRDLRFSMERNTESGGAFMAAEAPIGSARHLGGVSHSYGWALASSEHSDSRPPARVQARYRQGST